MIPKLIPKPGRAVCIGVKPIKPMFFMDYDKEYFANNVPLDYLISFARRIHDDLDCKETGSSYSRNHFQIFKTKGGFHMVQILATWKLVKQRLLYFKHLTGVKYEMNPKQIRLRISPKFKFETGQIMSRAPKMYYSCAPIDDIRFSDRTKREYYFTLKM